MASEKIMSLCKHMQWEAVALILICCYLVTPGVAQCNPEWCGSKNVTFPFWINKSSCGLPGFQMKCLEKKNGTWSLFLGTSVNSKETDLEILDLSYDGSLIINSTDLKAMSCNQTDDAFVYFELPTNGPFTIYSSNKFMVIGCKSKGSFELREIRGVGEGKCESACFNTENPSYCNTFGCCEAGIPGDVKAINFTGGGVGYAVIGFPVTCGFSTILDPGTWDLPKGELGRLGKGHYGIRLQWGINGGDCSTTRGTANYSCADAAQCFNSTEGSFSSAHTCQCLTGYQGSGYSRGTGCIDVDECLEGDLNECIEASRGGICYNLPGTYNCSCAKGYSGDGFQNGTRCQPQSSNNSAIKYATIGSVTSFVAVCLAASLLVWWLKKRHLKIVEAKYFQKLQQYIASLVGRESLRMFSLKELARASNNYSKQMVLGTGGFGTVFKGILLDGTLVAIKKSKQVFKLDDDHDFLNEVAILSQINHRNIVKLLGCCIQSKFPMLVSEFVPNGTLFYHLHREEGCLSWPSRLEIAIKTGEALAYLHSGASQPIFHRDVKSSNILLNETFSPKLADFGISRLISASNNTHITTDIKGTRGYLDHEYFQTYQLTDKSDVFSFGVVLVELLTGLKPLCAERANEEWNLSAVFLARLDDNRLEEILDKKVVGAENMQQMEGVAILARECLHLERTKRVINMGLNIPYLVSPLCRYKKMPFLKPSMKEVVDELVWIRGGTRKTKSHNGEDGRVEHTSIHTEASHTPPNFRSHTFPFAGKITSEESFTAKIQMSSAL